MSLTVQAVFFSKKIWKEAAAKKWVDDHDFKSDSPQHDDQSYIYRQWDPSAAKNDSWRTLANDFPDGVSVSMAEQKDLQVKYSRGTLASSETMEYILSDESVDRVGDVIEAKGWDLEQFKQNPIALFGHDHSKIIGQWKDVRTEGGKLKGRLALAKEGTSPLVDEVRSLIKQGILKAVSVGFKPLDAKPRKNQKGYTFTRASLHEVSLVAVPCNPNALAMAKAYSPNADLFFSNPAESGEQDADGVDESDLHEPTPNIDRAKSYISSWRTK